MLAGPAPIAETLPFMVDVRHKGQISLKGLAQTVTAMSINPTMLSGRVFPEALPGNKAKLIGRPKGLRLRVKLPSAIGDS